MGKATIVSIDTTPVGDDPLGELTAGVLKLQVLSLHGVVFVNAAQPSITVESAPGRWYLQRDHDDCADLKNQNVTLVKMILAPHYSGGTEYYLVLKQLDLANGLFRRIGVTQRALDFIEQSQRHDGVQDFQRQKFTIT